MPESIGLAVNSVDNCRVFPPRREVLPRLLRILQAQPGRCNRPSLSSGRSATGILQGLGGGDQGPLGPSYILGGLRMDIFVPEFLYLKTVFRPRGAPNLLKSVEFC